MTLHYIEESSIDIDHDSIIAQIEYSPDSFETSSEADLERAPSQTSNDEDRITDELSDANLEFVKLEGRKYKYNIPVDVNDGDKGTGFKLLSVARPHMRAFWATNIAHRASVFMWFSAVPLYSEIQKSLNITMDEIWISTISAMLGALVGRLIAGLACGKYGARLTSAALIIFSTLPTTLQGAVTNTTSLCIARFFCAFGGGVFVASVSWMDDMYIKEFSARINGFSGGLGAATGMCQGLLGLIVFPLFSKIWGSTEKGWRLSFSFVSFGCFITGLGLIFFTDDTPRGNYAKLKKTGEISPVPMWDAFRLSINDRNIWILFIQHGLNFGVELAINNALISYFKDDYGLNNKTAIILASVFPAANQFARIGGGRLSDKAHIRNGMKGRLQCQFGFLFVAGVIFVFFSYAKNLWVSMACLCIMAVLLLFSQSATYGIVPYIKTNTNQAVSGIVGAGGAAGGIGCSLIFRQLPTYRGAFCVIGYLIVFSSLLTLLMNIPGHGSLFSKTEDTTGKCLTSCVTKDTHEDIISIDTSSECANELVDSMRIETTSPQQEKNIDDLPSEINFKNLVKSLDSENGRPKLEKDEL